ncbi:MAG: histidinol-phosphate aminotransferase [Paenibacillaceae bacterium]|nr:histidinol-phosphate aminotransferase [Paenibacillaceae bacterium]
MQPKQNIVHLPVYQPGKPIEEVKRELGLSHVIKLASNENPFGCSPKAKEAMQAEFANISLYPDGGAVDLTNVLAGDLGVNADQIIFGAGSDDVIMMIARAFLVPGDETVMATHTFGQYKHNAEVEGAVCVEVPLKDGVHDLSAMLAKVNGKTKIVWICNPNNPTGTAVSLEEIERFIQSVPKSVMVVLDEAYYEYLPPAQFSHSIDLVKKYGRRLSLRYVTRISSSNAARTTMPDARSCKQLLIGWVFPTILPSETSSWSTSAGRPDRCLTRCFARGLSCAAAISLTSLSR